MLATYLRQFDALVAERLARGRPLAVLAGLCLLFAVGVFPAASAWRAPDGSSPVALDGRWSYTPAEARQLLDTLGADGRMRYALVELTADLIFPVVNCLLFAALISYLYRRAQGERWYRRLTRLPLVYLLADYSENAGVVAMLINYPAQAASTAQMAALFTSIKWLLVGACLLAVLAGAVQAWRRGGAR